MVINWKKLKAINATFKNIALTRTIILFYFQGKARNSFINEWAECLSPDAGCSSIQQSQDGTKRKNVVYLIKCRNVEICSN